VTQLEIVHEAAKYALEDAGLSHTDVDYFMIGDMELFQGDYQSDNWHVAGYGGVLKDGCRLTTGGTTGSSLVAAGQCYVASGLYDTAIVIGWQKHDEGNAATGLNSGQLPEWASWYGAGVTGGFASAWINRFGRRAELAAAKHRVLMADNALMNEYAHLRTTLTEDDVLNSPPIAFPMRMAHLCPSSTAACALVLACEERAKTISQKPVWLRDFVISHMEDDSPETGSMDYFETSMRDAARKLYERNHITDPLEELDVMELYDPVTWIAMKQLAGFLQCSEEELLSYIEEGVFERDGKLSINPSGGVQASNPIGATAMIRVAEAALQIRGDAGAHQLNKEVNTALASGFGGTLWTNVHLLTKTLD
jgi:acetyl-CoA C-acetyltransferase